MKESTRKKRNTALFMVIATIINIVIMLVFLMIGMILLAKFNPAGEDGSASAAIWVMVIFIVSLGLSWLCYGFMVKVYTKHVNMEENFAPITFGSKNRKRQKRQEEEPSGINMKG